MSKLMSLYVKSRKDFLKTPTKGSHYELQAYAFQRFWKNGMKNESDLNVVKLSHGKAFLKIVSVRERLFRKRYNQKSEYENIEKVFWTWRQERFECSEPEQKGLPKREQGQCPIGIPMHCFRIELPTLKKQFLIRKETHWHS